MTKPTFIDLFAGAGGLSEGFIQAGYQPIAHVEIDKNACESLKTRMGYYFLKENNRLDLYYQYILGGIEKEEFRSLIPKSHLESVINSEINNENLPGIFEQIDLLTNQKPVDVIIGGPPCQAYSNIGRARDPNGMKGDSRNYLFRFYAKFLERYQPKLFVFENVTGLVTAKNGEYLKKMRSAFYKAGYNTDFRVLMASDFGVLQKRKRVIMIGWKKETDFHFPTFEKQESTATINDLLHDLPVLEPGDKYQALPYSKSAHEYITNSGLRNGQNHVTLNYTHGHNPRDLQIYRLAISKWLYDNQRLYYSDIPAPLQTHKNTRSFTDRFKVVNGEGYSHTVVAHAGKDGHYYIYPSLDQVRSLSCRELARIQSFPDDYYFEGGMGSIYKQIGNAVPPMMAKQIAERIRNQA